MVRISVSGQCGCAEGDMLLLRSSLSGIFRLSYEQIQAQFSSKASESLSFPGRIVSL